MFNLTPFIASSFGILFLEEHPSRGQWLGIALPDKEITGLVLVVLGVLIVQLRRHYVHAR